MPVNNDLIAYEDDLVAQRIVERPDGSNRTVIGERFGWNGVPWCAETQSVAVEAVFGRRIGWSAAVSVWIAMAQRGDNGMEWISPNGWIEAGMLVTYDFGPSRGLARGNPANFHIAMVRDPATQGTFQTDGGNESNGMRMAWRDRKYVSGFIRLPYDASTPPDPSSPIQGDIDMTPGQCRDLVGRKWFFVVGTDQALYASVDAAKFFRIGGIFTSGVDAFTETDGRIVITGRALDGQLQQCVVYTDGQNVKPPGSAPDFELLGGHIFP